MFANERSYIYIYVVYVSLYAICKMHCFTLDEEKGQFDRDYMLVERVGCGNQPRLYDDFITSMINSFYT